jgi:hypothetical protein
MQGGHVTLVATNATVRQILAEWERVGQTRVMNPERTPGAPLNLQLTDVPEQQALDIVLRSVPGVILARRQGTVDNFSAFERIIVMPISSLPQAAAPPSSAPPAFGQATFQPPQVQLPPPDDDDDRPVPPGAQPVNRGAPVFVFPQPGNAQQQMPNPMGGVQNGGVAVPQQPPTFRLSDGGPVMPYPIPSATGGVPQGGMPQGVAVPGMVVPAPQPQPGQPGFIQPLPPQRPPNP